MKMQVRPSKGSVGDACDSAMAESFFASLEGELIERSTFPSKAQARMAIFTWVEGWYNSRRRHIGLGYYSPLNFERSNEALFDVSKMLSWMSRQRPKPFGDQAGTRPRKWVNSMFRFL